MRARVLSAWVAYVLAALAFVVTGAVVLDPEWRLPTVAVGVLLVLLPLSAAPPMAGLATSLVSVVSGVAFLAAVLLVGDAEREPAWSIAAFVLVTTATAVVHSTIAPVWRMLTRRDTTSRRGRSGRSGEAVLPEAELVRARRYERPLSVGVLEMQPRSTPRSWTLAEQLLYRAECDAAVTRLTERRRRSDIVLPFRTSDSELVVVAPETDADGLDRMFTRLGEQLRDQLPDLQLKWAVSSFPEDGPTYASLVGAARDELERRGVATADEIEILTTANQEQQWT